MRILPYVFNYMTEIALCYAIPFLITQAIIELLTLYKTNIREDYEDEIGVVIALEMLCISVLIALAIMDTIF